MTYIKLCLYIKPINFRYNKWRFLSFDKKYDYINSIYVWLNNYGFFP